MNLLINFSILFYILSTIGYFVYLFIQKDRWRKIGFYFISAGFVFHMSAVLLKTLGAGYFPATNLHETLLSAGAIFVGVFLIFQHQYQIKILGIYTAPLAAMMALASAITPVAAGGSKTLFKSFWLVFHIAGTFSGEAFFGLACGIGILYLIQENAIKSKRHRFFYKRLPSLEMLDSTGHICIVTGFTLLTAGLIAGLIYARLVWGRFVSWDPKEVWSGISWFLYAVLIHGRVMAGWKGRKAAIMAILGFVVLLFTFVGVNFLMKGHHWEFTR